MRILLILILILFFVYIYQSLTSPSQQIEVAQQEQVIHQNDTSVADFTVDSIVNFIPGISYMDLFGVFHTHSELAYYLLSFMFFTEDHIISYFLANIPDLTGQVSWEKQLVFLNSLFTEMSKTFDIHLECTDKLTSFFYNVMTNTPVVMHVPSNNSVSEFGYYAGILAKTTLQLQ